MLNGRNTLSSKTQSVLVGMFSCGGSSCEVAASTAAAAAIGMLVGLA